MKKDKIMNKYFKEAENLINGTIEELTHLLPQDGEDISFYNPEILDEEIDNLIKARTLIGIGRYIDG